MPRRKTGALHLKIRVRVTERMTKREMLRRFKRTVENGAVQPGLEIVLIDWEKATSTRLRSGEYMGREAEAALAQMYRMMISPGWTGRVEVVDQ
jgi:anti-sigma factor RsiW